MKSEVLATTCQYEANENFAYQTMAYNTRNYRKGFTCFNEEFEFVSFMAYNDATDSPFAPEIDTLEVGETIECNGDIVTRIF